MRTEKSRRQQGSPAHPVVVLRRRRRWVCQALSQPPSPSFTWLAFLIKNIPGLEFGFFGGVIGYQSYYANGLE